MKSSDPNRAHVRAEISIHDALAAIEHFAANYPTERLSANDSMRLRRAAEQYDKRLAEHKFTTMHTFDISTPEGASNFIEKGLELGLFRKAVVEESPAGYGHGV